ncbi:MAG: glutamine ABC transporter ATP-binding protein [Clostridiales bacterium]|nr:MAG: glutamine ABC transporter ATP-binding protein [Clostridiales bacterium]
MIEIIDIRKSFGDLEVLKGVSLSVKKGEIISIIGSSGSGKSTLLRCINQLEQIDSGEILIHKCSINKKSIHRKEMLKKTGMVFQQFNLFPHYNVLQNISKPLMTVNKFSKEKAYQLALDTLKTVKLEDKTDNYPLQLSGGQKQRVAIARELAMGCEIILFDEPTSALDPELAFEVLNTIKSLANSGRTMLIVTHHIDFAKEISDRILFIDDGIICEEGTPCQVILNPENDRTKQFLNKINKLF